MAGSDMQDRIKMFAWMPPELRLPVLAGVIVFAAAVITTQIALGIGNRVGDRQMELVGQVYLDGLSANVGFYLRAGNMREVENRFDRAFEEQQGIREKLLLVLQGPEGKVAVETGDHAYFTDAVRLQPDGTTVVDEGRGVAWAVRAVAGVPDMRIVAALDVREILDARGRLRIGVVLVDLLVAALCSIGAYMGLRRLSRPIDRLMGHLSGAGNEPAPISPEEIAEADRQSARLLHAYNRMVAGVRERKTLAARLAEREQAAALGRLTATIAHEVRNPLAGMATGVSTLKRFGGDEEVRAETIGLLERGIEAIDGIVTSTLNLYRPEEERRLTRTDFDDLRLLVRPAAAKRGVVLDWHIDLPDSLTVAAVSVRQVLLNLLLNACAASPSGGVVTLEARIEGSDLICIVADQGGGMDDAGSDRLDGSEPGDGEGKRLGLDVIVSILGSLEGRASVRSGETSGTVIQVTIPLEGGEA